MYHVCMYVYYSIESGAYLKNEFKYKQKDFPILTPDLKHMW